MSDASDEEVGFGGTDRKRFAESTAERVFQKKNRAFDENSVTVKIIPMLSTTGNTGVKAQFFFRISINTATVRGLLVQGIWQVQTG